MRVEPRQRLLHADRVADPARDGNPARPGAVEDLRATRSARRGSSTCAAENSSTRSRRTKASPCRAGGCDRRRQMADRDGADPALGGRRLAGIVDDEGVDHRRRAPPRGAASRRAKGRRLCRAAIPCVPCVPRWMSASTRSRRPQAEIEGEIGVGRRPDRGRDSPPCGRRCGRGRAGARRGRGRRAQPRKRKAPPRTAGSTSAGPNGLELGLALLYREGSKPGPIGGERHRETVLSVPVEAVHQGIGAQRPATRR